MGGHVRVDGQVVTKAGTRVADDAAVEVAEQAPYVSRAGGKLATGARRVRLGRDGRARARRRRLHGRLHRLPAAARRGRGDRARRRLRAAARAGAHRSARDRAGAHQRARPDRRPAAVPARPRRGRRLVHLAHAGARPGAGRRRRRRGGRWCWSSRSSRPGASRCRREAWCAIPPCARRPSSASPATLATSAGCRSAPSTRVIRGPPATTSTCSRSSPPTMMHALQRPAPDPAALARDAVGA